MNNIDSLPLILAIDTSCDETSAAVCLGRVVLSNIVASQAEIHRPYGGVFPTLAKQAHQENIAPVVQKAIKQAGIKQQMLDAIAVTQGPGLAPALEVGIEYAQKLARKWNKPLIGINHVEAHLWSVVASQKKRDLPIKQVLELKKNNHKVPSKLATPFKLSHKLLFPVLGIIVSGGHSQFVQINQVGQYNILGETVDDALGEALDKVGRMLDLGYPAGPVIEKMAQQGNSTAFDFPLPMTESGDFNLSYSGLKTAANRLIKSLQQNKKKELKTSSSTELTKQEVFDLAASFQYAAFRHLCYKLDKILASQKDTRFSQVWLGGGVASNLALRQQIRKTIKDHKLQLKIPFNKRLCGDNAAMIGVTANIRIGHKLTHKNTNLDRKPSWSLEII